MLGSGQVVVDGGEQRLSAEVLQALNLADDQQTLFLLERWCSREQATLSVICTPRNLVLLTTFTITSSMGR